MVKFSSHNHKINLLARFMGIPQCRVLSFDIPAAYSCRKADICRTYAHKVTGKLQRVGRVLCYAAKQECYLPSVRNLRWWNYNQLLACGSDVNLLYELISISLPARTSAVRIHSSGDFYSKEYFTAWCFVARMNPNIEFYGYTKELDYVLAPKSDNFSLVYSFGGEDDTRFLALPAFACPACFIEEYDNQYPNYRLICGKGGEHEDFYAIQNNETFVLKIH